MPSTMTLKFGTSGLRGLATDLTRETCLAYTAAFLDLLRQRGETLTALCIAGDLRPSSPDLVAWCSEMARMQGLRIIDGGAVPTPAIAAYALRRHLPAMMITASHNPSEHNGIKFYRPDGELTKDDEGPMKALVATSIVHLPVGPAGRDPVTGDVADEYISTFETLFGPDTLRGMRLGIDQHSAVGRDLLVRTMQALGATCTIVRRSEQFVAVDTEALGADYLAAAAEWQREGRFAAIVSTDGDGDRPLLIDETGRQVQGDVLGVLAARYLGFRDVVTPVSSTSAVESSGWFPTVERTRIGSPFVIAGMQKLLEMGAVAVAGFEGNGGFLTGGNLHWRGRPVTPLMTRDALLPLIAVLAMANEARSTTSALTAALPQRVKATGRIADIDTQHAGAWIDALVASLAVPDRPAIVSGAIGVERIDGAKFLFADGTWLHFRLSGNAPELRCYVESSSVGESADVLDRALLAASQALAERHAA